MPAEISRPTAILMFTMVVVFWGLNWPVTRILVETLPPLTAMAIRSALGTVALFALLIARGQFIIPSRGDLPVVIVTAVTHMVLFSTLIAAGLQLVPVGRSVVLGYTMPIWVTPGAWLLLRERMNARQLLGVAISIAGLLVMFNPVAFDWSDRDGVIGNGLILLAAFCWSLNILYVRHHRWIATPFQLVAWQALLATGILAAGALAVDDIPTITWTPRLVGAFFYGSVFGIAIGYWAMAMVNRSLPAVTTSLGILAAPVVGVGSAMVLLGEPLDLLLVAAMAMILGGIAIGTIRR